jgi:hypothetical protein
MEKPAMSSSPLATVDLKAMRMVFTVKLRDTQLSGAYTIHLSVDSIRSFLYLIALLLTRP